MSVFVSIFCICIFNLLDDLIRVILCFEMDFVYFKLLFVLMG